MVLVLVLVLAGSNRIAQLTVIIIATILLILFYLKAQPEQTRQFRYFNLTLYIYFLIILVFFFVFIANNETGVKITFSDLLIALICIYSIIFFILNLGSLTYAFRNKFKYCGLIYWYVV